jgi:hypothetical protein
MTLIIANRFGSSISLCSDSRISFKDEKMYDNGIKIFSVPVKIYSAQKTREDLRTLDFDYKIGLGIVGSTFNSYTIKESIYEMLQNLEYKRGIDEISLDSIVKLVFKVYNTISIDIENILGPSARCEILLVGHCPKKNRNQIFRFFWDTENLYEPTFKEILKGELEIDFFGSGANIAKEVYRKNPNASSFKVIKMVVDNENVMDVGGDLQYGVIQRKNFEVRGIIYDEQNADGSFKRLVYKLRGINMDKGDFQNPDDELFVSYTYSNPFNDEMVEKWGIGLIQSELSKNS